MEKLIEGKIELVSFENHKLPDFIEKKGKDYVYYGEDNLYPDYLINLYTRDAFNNAIITGKSNFIFGKGLAVEGKQKDVKADAFLKLANPYETWNDITIKAISDLELFNGFAFEVIWGNGKILEYYHVDFSKLRSNKDSTEFYYCDTWKTFKPEKEESYRVFKPFTTTGSGSQLFYYKVYRPSLSGNSNVYPLPDYVGCVADIETDVEITNFHFNNVKHGFSAGTMVNFNNGTPTQEKIDIITKKFKGKFTGTDKSGNVILTFNENKDREATVVSLQPNNLDKQFEILAQRLQQNIFSGHKVTTPMLFGIKTAGQLGGRTELLDGWEHFKNTYILNRRAIIERSINEFGKLAGMPEFILVDSEPIGIVIPESVIATALTPDEIRMKLGFEPVEKPQTTAADITLNAINTLSPLVANNVLGAMTTNEIRALAVLPPIAGGDTIPTAQPTATPTTPAFRKFTKEDDEKLINLFKQYGEPSENFIVIKEKKFNFANINEVIESEGMLKQQFATPLTIEVDTLEKKILSLIDKDPLISIKDLAKALKVSVKEISSSINKLVDGGALKIKDTVIDEIPTIERTLTDGGQGVVEEAPQKIIDISVVYQYKVAPGLGEPIIPTTRIFCKELIKLDKKFKRLEIELISDSVGYSVWAERGGFYHNPKTGITTPYCRHIWVQQLVKKIR